MFCSIAQTGISAKLMQQEKNTSLNSDSTYIVNEIAKSRQLHRSDHNDSLEAIHAENAINMSLKIGDSILYAEALDNSGLLNRYHQNYEEAFNLHVKAFQIAMNQPTASPLSKMIYGNNAGVASRYAQQYDKAVKYYQEALKIAEAESDLKNIAISCNGLGNTLLHIPTRDSAALGYFKRSLAAEEARGNSLGVAMNYLSISDFFNHKKQYEEARTYMEKLLRINIERKDTFGLAITYEFFGLNYFEEGNNLEKAEMYYQKSLTLFLQLNNIHKMADIYLHLADINRNIGNYGLAISNYKKSWALAEKINSKGLIQVCANGLSKIYESQNKLQLALKYYKISNQYKDSIAMNEQETAIAAIEKKYALEQKETLIELLEKDKKLQETELDTQTETLKNQKFLLLLLLIGFVAIITIVLLQYRNIQIKKKSNKLLREQNSKILKQKEEIEKVNTKLQIALAEIVDQQQKNEEKRVKLLEIKFENKIQSLTLQSLESQMNPHFLFNGMNAVRWLVIQNKNEKAMKYLDTFANLLRLSLTSNRKNVIELGEELRTTSLYLEIEKLRFDNEFSFEVNIAEGIDVDKLMVPPKILQPLAENAVKHGLLPSRKIDKQLNINVFEMNKGICIEVVDNGMGFKIRPNNENDSRPDGTHLGLKLIKERLSIYNQQNDKEITFKIGANKDANDKLIGTKAQIWIALVPIFKTELI
jgi:tetratricopeptide (TPR) repeat protein